MKRITKIVGAFAITAAALSLDPAQSHADPTTITSSEQSFADQAWPATCGYLDQKGVTVDSVIFLIKTMYNSGGIPLKDTPMVVNYIVWNYCPRWYPSLTAMGQYFREQPTSTPGAPHGGNGGECPGDVAVDKCDGEGEGSIQHHTVV